MSNIDRKYAYHDDGVLPAQGEYGVTYLTLYSSGAGNTYDGWIWDPDRINYSETARTFGYRNPSYPDYCWDDEVVVDLSNAQARQESSDFTQGRIVSFNTNVSDRPILLRDIDVTGMTEEEREARATTVLFTAIPLVKDAYIQANVEIAMKMNLSPNNTTGNIRVEAFYIINNESDRTMRPHPINHYTVTRSDEYNMFSPLYFNFALNHEDNNYIGVKLIVSGGTAEIGISDNPDYGDAIITITSAGMTGDNVYSGKPQSLEIYGKEYVPIGYKINEADYTVLCTYDTGEIYDVSRLCDYNPKTGTKIVDPITTLSAYYQGLTASMYLYLAQVESIELIGLSDFYEDEYELNIDDYIVMAYYDTGDTMDVTDEPDLSFSPAMGTIITDDTRLTATYTPEYMPGSTFEDSMDITKHSSIMSASNDPNGLVYTLYDDYLVVITGNSRLSKDDGSIVNEVISLPQNIITYMNNNHIVNYRMKWNATGDISGFGRLYARADTTTSNYGGVYGILTKLINFEDVNIRPYYAKYPPDSSSDAIPYNKVSISFAFTDLTSSDIAAISSNIELTDIGDYKGYHPESIICRDYQSGGTSTLAYAPDFRGNKKITDINFSSNWDLSQISDISSMFMGCTNLNDISAASNWKISNKLTSAVQTFCLCESLTDYRAVSNWDLSKVTGATSMFEYSGLRNLSDLFGANIGTNVSGSVVTTSMFNHTKLKNLNGFANIYNHSNIDMVGLFRYCDELESLDGIGSCDFTRSNNVRFMNTFSDCSKLKDIGDLLSCNMTNVTSVYRMFYRCDNIESPYLFGDLYMPNCTMYRGAFELSNFDMETLPDESVKMLLDGPNITISNVFYTSTYQGATRIETRSISGRYYDYYTREGMLSIRDRFHKSSASDPGHPFIEFERADLLPDWYKKMIAENITPGVIYSYN